MANKKRIIYHIPWDIVQGRKSATGIRPLEILEGFRATGIDVDVVMGNGKIRSDQIKKIKYSILQGVKYDFIYSESSTAPTFIASGWRDYLRYGNMDLNFLKFCRRKQIPLSLFYRDIYWKFPIYLKFMKPLKRFIMSIGYRLDLLWYKKWVNLLYLPSMKMNYLLGKYNFRVKALPPATVERKIESKSNDKQLQLFYVGGINESYRLHNLFSAVSKLKSVNLRFCTRESEWNVVKHEYVTSDNITVIHKSGNELIDEYKKCDIALLFFESDIYRTFAMPVKMFEYLSFIKPIIATCDTAAGEWVEEHNIGWTIPYDEEALTSLLIKIKNDTESLVIKQNSIKKIKKDNLWISRAKQVIEDMS